VNISVNFVIRSWYLPLSLEELQDDSLPYLSRIALAYGSLLLIPSFPFGRQLSNFQLFVKHFPEFGIVTSGISLGSKRQSFSRVNWWSIKWKEATSTFYSWLLYDCDIILLAVKQYSVTSNIEIECHDKIFWFSTDSIWFILQRNIRFIPKGYILK